jgi:hypothetical protein
MRALMQWCINTPSWQPSRSRETEDERGWQNRNGRRLIENGYLYHPLFATREFPFQWFQNNRDEKWQTKDSWTGPPEPNNFESYRQLFFSTLWKRQLRSRRWFSCVRTRTPSDLVRCTWIRGRAPSCPGRQWRWGGQIMKFWKILFLINT